MFLESIYFRTISRVIASLEILCFSIGFDLNAFKQLFFIGIDSSLFPTHFFSHLILFSLPYRQFLPRFFFHFPDLLFKKFAAISDYSTSCINKNPPLILQNQEQNSLWGLIGFWAAPKNSLGPVFLRPRPEFPGYPYSKDHYYFIL